jgi:predicted phage terminase large subunit-like protein
MQPTDPTALMYRDILRRDFVAFNVRAHAEIAAQTKLSHNWHLEVMAAKLEEVRRGRCRRLIVNLPPRHLKSHTVSVAFVAWCLGHDPAKQIMCVSYAQDLSDKLARDCRSLMLSQFYRFVFATRLSPERQALSDFLTGQGGGRFSTSVAGVLTGRGADMIVIDDPLKADEAGSPARRGAVNEWFDNTLYSRLNDKENGQIIIVMQRLHEDDLAGHVLEQGGWDVLKFPAIAEEDERTMIATPYGPRSFARKKDEPLHGSRESHAMLEGLRARLGTTAFAAQYQQAPSPPEGLLVKAAWFPRYTPDQLPRDFDAKILSCDTANKVSEFSDYTVCTIWGTYDDDIYLLHVLRKRMEFPELKRTIKELATAHRTTNILIEDRASGTQLIQELRHDNLVGVKGITPPGDKQMRLAAQTPTMEAGRVHLPVAAPWLDDYLHELTTFPNAKHDDQVDSTSQALAWMRKRPNENGWLKIAREWQRKKAEEDEEFRREDALLRGGTRLIE